jgi:hypothetical protein
MIVLPDLTPSLAVWVPAVVVLWDVAVIWLIHRWTRPPRRRPPRRIRPVVRTRKGEKVERVHNDLW